MVRRAVSTVSLWTTASDANASCTPRRSQRMLRAKFEHSTSISTNSSRNSSMRSTFLSKKNNVLTPTIPSSLLRPSDVSGRKSRQKRKPFRPNYQLNLSKKVKQRKLLKVSNTSLAQSTNKWKKNRSNMLCEQRSSSSSSSTHLIMKYNVID